MLWSLFFHANERFGVVLEDNSTIPIVLDDFINLTSRRLYDKVQVCVRECVSVFSKVVWRGLSLAVKLPTTPVIVRDHPDDHRCPLQCVAVV